MRAPEPCLCGDRDCRRCFADWSVSAEEARSMREHDRDDEDAADEKRHRARARAEGRDWD